jgi:hypothetical protein
MVNAAAARFQEIIPAIFRLPLTMFSFRRKGKTLPAKACEHCRPTICARQG